MVAAVATGEDLIDPEIRAHLAQQGITALYPPQVESLPSVLEGRSTVVAIPTASGKSLIAYLGILHRFKRRSNRGKALYIVPLRALASEKFEELRAFKGLGLKVGIATGDPDDEDGRLSRFDVVVCTSEKADSLLRHRAQWLSDVDQIVADEVHLINDGGRGPTLEVLLARFRALRSDLQIIALSATIANADEIAKWLGATLIQSDWRPTPLKRGILFGRAIQFEDGSRRIVDNAAKDPVADLVIDMLAEGGQSLVFVNTRRSAEAVARRLGGQIGKRLDAPAKAKLEALAKEVIGAGEPSHTAERLAGIIRGGVAFHNAGLESRQRKLVEAAFRDGTLKCLAATPTLAAGVNTPARRVVIRDVWRYEVNYGNKPIPVMEIMQMMGRAGRPRYDPYGEAVLLAKTEDDVETLRQSYIEAEPEPVTSKLGAEPALRMHVLATIAGGFANTESGVFRFLDSTFYAHQGEAWLIKEQTRQVLRFLIENGFLTRDGDGLSPTLFGKRTSDLYIDPLSALTLRKALERAKQRAEPSTFAFLHALCATVDLGSLFLCTKDDWVMGKAAEVEEELLLGLGDALDQEDFLSQVKTAALLEAWIEETPMDAIEDRYGVAPGDLRDKVDRARWLSHALREIARLVNYEAVATLNDLPTRLESGAKAELLPLIRLDGVGRVRARRLHAAGFTGLAKIRNATQEQLQRVDTIGPRLAASLLSQVRGGEARAKDRSESSLETF
jgi:helicase